MLSPPIRVIWDGFVSDTRTLQRCGWEFAISLDHAFYETIHAVAKHRKTDIVLSMRGAMAPPSLTPRSLAPEFGELVVTDVSALRNIRVWQLDTASLMRVDMASQFVGHQERALAECGIWRPWHPTGDEIIVEPKTVESLLAEIRRMQEPELAEIRRRNRARERVQQEQVVAQVIAFAA